MVPVFNKYTILFLMFYTSVNDRIKTIVIFVIKQYNT